MKNTTTLYYGGFPEFGKKRFYDDLLGRALTQEEYENITAEELRDAICHSAFLWQIDIEERHDWHPTLAGWQEFISLSAEQPKERLRRKKSLLIRSDEPLFRIEFPLITRGPRKGHPTQFEDRVY